MELPNTHGAVYVLFDGLEVGVTVGPVVGATVPVVVLDPVEFEGGRTVTRILCPRLHSPSFNGTLWLLKVLLS
jgi:hypothetical protein